MVAIARRLAIDLSRRPQPLSGDNEPELIDENEGPGSVPRHQLTDDLKRLLTCIGRLEPDRQRMLLLAYYGAFSREQLREARYAGQSAQGVAAAQSGRD